MKFCFPPVVNDQTRVLILGSLPGEASLQACQYYAYPRNQFWRLLQAVLDYPLVELAYPDKLAALQAHRIGLWDVIRYAKRKGSLDTAIREQQSNDLRQLVAQLPNLQVVAFNGATAAREVKQLAGLPYLTLFLPSSSPAYTAAFEHKLRIWRQLESYIFKAFRTTARWQAEESPEA